VTAIPLRRIEGKYEILEKLGEGGMGAIYKVRHRLLDEVRVIKMMRPQLLQDEELKARFFREARSAIRLRHPSIAHLYDFSLDDDDIAYIVMEHIQGVTLESLLRSGPPPLALALELGQQTLRALHYLHGRGFIHRDISPDNLMLSLGQEGEPLVKLIDLGIAKTPGGGVEFLTQEGTFLGKLRYASPEQFGHAGAAAVGPSGDLYSAGVVLYELLTGRYPISGSDASSLIAGHLFHPPLDFAESDPDGRVPEPLRALVLKALAKKPEDRFASAREMAEALAAFRAPDDLEAIDLQALLDLPPQQAHPEPISLPVPGSTQDRLDLQFMLRGGAPGATVRVREGSASLDDTYLSLAARYPLEEAEASPAGTLRFPVPASRPQAEPEEPASPEEALPEPEPVEEPEPVAAARPMEPERLASNPPQPRPRETKSRTPLYAGAALLLVLAAAAGLFLWKDPGTAKPAPAPPPRAQTPAPRPRPAPQALAVQPPAPAPINPQLLLAQEALDRSDLPALQGALGALAPEQIALFTAEEQDLHRQVVAGLKPLQIRRWGENLARGLRSGDLRLLEEITAASPAPADLAPAQKRDLARARQGLAVYHQLLEALRKSEHPAVLKLAADLLRQFPGNDRAVKARKSAADSLLTEADTHIGVGDLDGALTILEPLRAIWRDHPGIPVRLDRIASVRRIDEQMDEALAAASRAEQEERPLEGLKALDRVRPNEGHVESFRQARERLQALFARLDRNPPRISMVGSPDLDYEKDAAVTIPLRIVDDQGAKTAVAWARPEGGRFKRIPVRALGGPDYEIEILPDLHQNKNIDFYVEATDQSGHRGALGSAPQPQKIKRKKWFERGRW